MPAARGKTAPSGSAGAARPLESRESKRSQKTVSINDSAIDAAADDDENLLTSATVGKHNRSEEDPSEMWERLRKNCADFVFPSGQRVVPRALARAAAYSRFGPAVETVDINGRPRLRLNSARKGRGVLMDHEEHLLLKDEEAAVVADIYCTATPSTAHAASMRPPKVTAAATIDGATFGEMNAKKHPLVHQLLEISRSELNAILDAVVLPTAEKDGAPLRESTVLNAISDALLGERQRRINVVKSSTPSLSKIRNDTEVTNRNATRFYNRTNPKAYEIRSWEEPKDVLRALHRTAYQITEVGEKQKAQSVSLNVRCLRPELDLRDGSVKEGWDSYCCVRNTRDSRATTLRK